jgi:hypothetical protein
MKTYQWRSTRQNKSYNIYWVSWHRTRTNTSLQVATWCRRTGPYMPACISRESVPLIQFDNGLKTRFIHMPRPNRLHIHITIHTNTHIDINASSRGRVLQRAEWCVCVWGGRRGEEAGPLCRRGIRVGTCSATISTAISIITASPLHNRDGAESDVRRRDRGGGIGLLTY